MKMSQTISLLSQKQFTTFVLGYPIQKLHAVKADDVTAELVDFSHAVSGGYLGSFGADLTTVPDLLRMRSPETYVLQYYTDFLPENFYGNQATLKIAGYEVADLPYKNTPAVELFVGHVPENELIAGEGVQINVDLSNYGKMINAVEMNYRNNDGIFQSIPLQHQRSASTENALKYTLDLPESVLGDKNFSYFFSLHTPYSLVSRDRVFTIPVNSYDDGIILKAQLVNKKEVLWSWDGPTVAKGKSFEVWSGDTLLTTTSDKHYTIPLTECNRYQIIQVKVIFQDRTKSDPSRPYEYYADADSDKFITEKEGVTLMINCLEEKEIDTYTKIAANTKDFSASKNLTLERAGLYLSKIIAEDIWQKIEKQNGYYELLYYIMIFINREEYRQYGLEGVDIPPSLVYKLITKVNHTENINAAYSSALNELGNRLRSTLSI